MVKIVFQYSLKRVLNFYYIKNYIVKYIRCKVLNISNELNEYERWLL